MDVSAFAADIAFMCIAIGNAARKMRRRWRREGLGFIGHRKMIVPISDTL